MTEVEKILRDRLPDLFVYLDSEKSIDDLDFDNDPDAEDKFQSLLKTNTSYDNKLNLMIKEAEEA